MRVDRDGVVRRPEVRPVVDGDVRSLAVVMLMKRCRACVAYITDSWTCMRKTALKMVLEVEKRKSEEPSCQRE